MSIFGEPPNSPWSNDEIALATAITALLNARSMREKRRVVDERKQVLLTVEADQALERLAHAHAEDFQAMGSIAAHRDLLRDCRVFGIKAAFERLDSPTPPSDSDRLAALIASLAYLTQPSDMVERARVCRQALELVDRTSAPDRWGALQADLGRCLLQVPGGEQGEHLDAAIEAFQAALLVFRGEDRADARAAVHLHLGVAYLMRSRGVDPEHIERAIDELRASLRVYQRHTTPHDWATAHTYLGEALFYREAGNRNDSLDESIVAYETAIDTYSELGELENAAELRVKLERARRARMDTETAP